MRASGESERPGPGEEHNPGAPVDAAQAASVILLRGGGATLQLLLVKRTPKARFMGGVWVFPGGAVDAPRATATRPTAPPAIRELREEAAIELDDPESW